MLDAIRTGVELPRSRTVRKLIAACVNNEYDISDDNLNAFINDFEAEEPGRHPPVDVRRELRVESSHRCGICQSDLPLQFHHIIGWEDLRHHDPHHMLAICGGCHSKIHVGQIDRVEQRRYKTKLQDKRDSASPINQTAVLFRDGSAAPLAWDDLRDIVVIMHETVVSAPTASSQFDFTNADLDEKNRLNKLGADSFAVMRGHDEPFFGRIQAFLESPTNASITHSYHEIVDELRRRIAAEQSSFDRFEDIFNQLYEVVCVRFGAQLKGKRRTLRILMSFMYFNCDIGRKQ